MISRLSSPYHSNTDARAESINVALLIIKCFFHAWGHFVMGLQVLGSPPRTTQKTSTGQWVPLTLVCGCFFDRGELKALKGCHNLINVMLVKKKRKKWIYLDRLSHHRTGKARYCVVSLFFLQQSCSKVYLDQKVKSPATCSCQNRREQLMWLRLWDVSGLFSSSAKNAISSTCNRG